MHKKIMLQGTGSSVGKSVLTAGLCRIFSQDGYKVAPFKSQNMALNSFVDINGKEMSRAQVVQAEAANAIPLSFMNPILMKPTGDDNCSQVIIEGVPYKNMDAKEYYAHYEEFKKIALRNYNKLKKDFDIGVLEGAGSPAEINLRDVDLVNMGMAKLVNAPVVLIADIERGGAFASIYGTVMLLDKSDRARIKGYIINKFRGDISLLDKGIEQLDNIFKKENLDIPCLGIIPFAKINIEKEDSYTYDSLSNRYEEKEIKIAIIKFERLSNSTDFDPFFMYDDVEIEYIESAEQLTDKFDIVILPGSKNAIYDFSLMRERGIAKKVEELANMGKLIIGIHSGFQMLGKSIKDIKQVESSYLKVDGLGFLDITTNMHKEKYTQQVEKVLENCTGILEGFNGIKINGYEIHQGVTTGDSSCSAVEDGGFSLLCKDNIIGTYIHGIFNSPKFTRKLLNHVRMKKGLVPIFDYMSLETYKEKEYKNLAKLLRKHLDMEKIYEILK